MPTYVKTVYGPGSMRLPNIAVYQKSSEADSMISATLKWGIDIVSCEKIPQSQAEEEVRQGKAEM